MSAELLTVVGIDPGRAKCGVAVVARGMDAPLLSQVVATDNLLVELARVLRQFPQISTIVMGDGTQSRPLRRALLEMFPQLPVELVDEHGTSLKARARYLAEHPPRGWRRFLPTGLRVPDQPYDDLVAVILAQQFLLNQQKNLQQSI